MAVRSIKNQYRGINAHLHSFWQGTGRWNRFHNVYITELMQSMKALLRPMGYTADIEESLQIRRTVESVSYPRGDLVIYDTHPYRPKTQLDSSLQTLTIPELLEVDEDVEHPYFAVVIYEQPEFQRGEAVAWIELLSPTNKGNHRDAQTYFAKRRLLLENGLVFVEIDFLHETPPTFPRLPDYTRKHPDSFPYRIVVLDPRPDFKTGSTRVHEFEVDQPIPMVDIPLNGGEVLSFDFGVPYQKVFEDSFYGDDVDYRQLPMNFDRYAPPDQLNILNRMLTVIEAQDLDKAPLPLTKALTSVEEGLSLI